MLIELNSKEISGTESLHQVLIGLIRNILAKYVEIKRLEGTWSDILKGYRLIR